VPAVEVKDLRKEFRRRDRKAGRFARRRMPALKPRPSRACRQLANSHSVRVALNEQSKRSAAHLPL